MIVRRKTGAKIIGSVLSGGVSILTWVGMLTTKDFFQGTPSLGIAVILGILFGGPALMLGLGISISNDYKRHALEEAKQEESKRLEQKNIGLTKDILNVVASTQKPLSVYDFMIRLNESEDIIQVALEGFVQKGLAERMINDKGLMLYKFSLIPLDTERSDILR